MFCFKLRNLSQRLRQPETPLSRFAVSGCLCSICHFGDELSPLHLGFAKRYFRLPHPPKAA
ncbi:hypothetical protein [Kingella oralis]|uniref:hypothetical protein n=1 Tax=Kingella oralis TaxID=505 RepID=UPI0034E4DF73